MDNFLYGVFIIFGMLKSDLHIHTNSFVKWEAKINPKELIDRASKLNFDVLAITEHATMKRNIKGIKFFDALRTYRQYKDYAKKKGILLLPGFEAHIEGKEVLFIDCLEDIKKYQTFESLYDLKNDSNAFIIAPHPLMFKDSCLRDKLFEHMKLWDAIEHTASYLEWFNSNIKAGAIALRCSKPFIATSDSHFFFQFGRNYSLIDSEKKKDDFLEAIRKKKIEKVVDPMKFHEALYFVLRWPYTQVLMEFE